MYVMSAAGEGGGILCTISECVYYVFAWVKWGAVDINTFLYRLGVEVGGI